MIDSTFRYLLISMITLGAMTGLLGAETPGIVINEFMAANDSTIADGNGEYSDWIELYNNSGAAVDLTGWFLTDDPDDLIRWPFPAGVTLDAGEYLLLFASGQTAYPYLDSQGYYHTNFKLDKDGEYLALVESDGLTIADEFAPEFPVQTDDVSYGLCSFPPAEPVRTYLDNPTPGTSNQPACTVQGWYAPLFSRAPGAFAEPFSLTLTTTDPDADIRYTLDGSVPTETSTLYTAPIPISLTTMVQARLYSPTLPDGGEVVSNAYLALDADVLDFSSNLPIVLIDTFGATLDQETFRLASTVFINTADDDRADIATDPTDFAGRIGIRIRGNSSTYFFEKQQYAFETWDEFNEDKKASILGFPRESDWILNGPYSDKTLMRNYLAYMWSNRIGRYAVRTRFVEVFLNTSGSGKISAANYDGLYVFMEKIKRDDDRVNIQKLEPTDNSEPEISGGYILKRDWEGSHFSTSLGVPLLYEEPKPEDITPQQAAWIKNYYDDFETVLHGSNFTDPVNGYAKYIDTDAFIDNNLLVELTRNLDGFRASYYMHKDRGGKLNPGPIWDYNVALGNADWEGRADYLPEGWRVLYDAPYSERQWYPRLFEDPEFRQKWDDRWVELRKDLLSTDRLMADIDDAAALLQEAQIRNFTRFPILGTHITFNPPGAEQRNTYQKEVDWLKDWVRTRVTWIDNHITRPVFNQNGGRVFSGYILTMSLPDDVSGQIYYTIDGSDPRLPDGSLSPAALAYIETGPLTLTANTHIIARIKNGPVWSTPNEARFSVGPLLFINECMADNTATLEDPDEPGEFPDWIELYNLSPDSVDVGGMYLTDDLDDPTKYQVPAGLAIPSGGYLLFWLDDDGTQGPTHTNFNLNAVGEQIALIDTEGITAIDSVTFGTQTADVSYGRIPDGGDSWKFFPEPTPSATNYYPAGMTTGDAISVNLISAGQSVGSLTAGVVPVGNWNDYPGDSGAMILKDSTGIQTMASFTFSSSAGALLWHNGGAAIPDDPGSNAMLDGHNYNSYGNIVSGTFTGIPYAEYDLYVYYNSGAIGNNFQTFTLRGTSTSLVGAELYSGADTSLRESNGTTDGNYVVFRDLTDSQLTVDATATAGYVYLNGFQIVSTQSGTIVIHAWNSTPAKGTLDIPPAMFLFWQSLDGLPHDVYFGTDPDEVAQADVHTAGIYQGRQPAAQTSFDPFGASPMAWDTTYYWRIDGVDNSTNPATITNGTLWSFTTFTPLCLLPPRGDTNHDCLVNLEDLLNLAEDWLSCGVIPPDACPF